MENGDGGLRKRSGSAAAAIQDDGTVDKTSIPQLEWVKRENFQVTAQHEKVFHEMQMRKKKRERCGVYAKEKVRHRVFMMVAFVFLYLVASVGLDGHEVVISFTLPSVPPAVLVIIFISIILAIYVASRILASLRWLIYFILLANFCSLIFYGNFDPWASDESRWLGFSYVAINTFIVASYVYENFIYPGIIQSEWFQSNIGSTKYWKARAVGSWTLTYRPAWWRVWESRKTCMYSGGLNAKGLPHGYGAWVDDSYHGEVLTGWWENGIAIGPFNSREYGTGNGLLCITIPYFQGSDDTFTSSKLFPSNDKAPRIGMASVECSVVGSFYSHLPCAKPLVEERIILGKEVAEMTKQIKRLTKNQLVIEETDTDIPARQDENLLATKTSPNVLLQAGIQSNGKPKLVAAHSVMQFAKDADSDEFFLSPVMEAPVMEENSSEVFMSSTYNSGVQIKQEPEALIFVGGFNSSMQHNLEVFGQLLSLTRLPSHIKPYVFGWPNGNLLSYRYATWRAASEKNAKNFVKLLDGIHDAGIRTVSIFCHSLGVQTVMGVFCDKEDGSRGEVSKRFKLAKDFKDISRKTTNNDDLLLCKSITLINPCFPLDAFIEHGFRTLRSITTTVIGDKDDWALIISEIADGIMNFLGFEQPKILQSKGFAAQRGLHRQKVVGRQIRKLYMKDEDDDQIIEEGRKFLLFQNLQLGYQKSAEIGIKKRRLWLDLDVIDTTTLETQIEEMLLDRPLSGEKDFGQEVGTTKVQGQKLSGKLVNSCTFVVLTSRIEAKEFAFYPGSDPTRKR